MHMRTCDGSISRRKKPLGRAGLEQGIRNRDAQRGHVLGAIVDEQQLEHFME